MSGVLSAVVVEVLTIYLCSSLAALCILTAGLCEREGARLFSFTVYNPASVFLGTRETAAYQRSNELAWIIYIQQYNITQLCFLPLQILGLII